MIESSSVVSGLCQNLCLALADELCQNCANGDNRVNASLPNRFLFKVHYIFAFNIDP